MTADLWSLSWFCRTRSNFVCIWHWTFRRFRPASVFRRWPARIYRFCPTLLAPVKAPGYITKQFGFHQSFRNGRTVDLQKRFAETAAGLIDLIGNDLFACTALTGDQDGGIRRGDRQGSRNSLIHLGAFEYEVYLFNLLCSEIIGLRFRFLAQ